MLWHDEAKDHRQSCDEGRFNQLCRTHEPKYANGNAAFHAVNECVFQEGRESRSRASGLLRLLQFLPDSFYDPLHSGNRSWYYSEGLDPARFADRVEIVYAWRTPSTSAIILTFCETTYGTFKKNGTFRNYRIASYTERYGYPEIGEKYLEQLASLFEGGYVDKPSHRFIWTVKKRNNQFVTIAEVLAVQDRWLEIIRDTANKLLAVQET